MFDWALESGTVGDEGVKFSAFAAGIHGCGKLVEKRVIEWVTRE
jgi:hypothetical protein